MKKQTTSRVLLILLNVPVFLIGVGMIVGGMFVMDETAIPDASVRTLLNEIEHNDIPIGNLLYAAVISQMITGGIICIFSVVGLCGALKKIRCCLIVHIFFLVLLVVMEVVVIVLWVYYRGRQVDEWIEGKMLTLLAKYKGPQFNDDISKGWNILFTDAYCCGVKNQYADSGTHNDFDNTQSVWYVTNRISTAPGEKVPASCCKGASTGSIPGYVNSATCTQVPTNFYSEGCYRKLRRVANVAGLAICLSLAVCIIIQVVNILLSCVMADGLKKRIRHTGETVTSDTRGKPQPPPYIGIDAVLKNKGRR